MASASSVSDAKIRQAQRWYYQMGKRVWLREIFHFLFLDRRIKNGPSVEQFWGKTLEHEENALAAGKPRVVAQTRAMTP